jgi:hypothetical protein
MHIFYSSLINSSVKIQLPTAETKLRPVIYFLWKSVKGTTLTTPREH